MQGKVKWFSEEKGYGFITSDSGEDCYFNVQSIHGASLPSNGDFVSFEVKPGDKGPKAFNVKITSKAQTKDVGRTDDRIACTGCGKKIVPRMITYRGNPDKSVCPYCATVIKEFSKCFIATAVFGDPYCPQVLVFRKYRDERLDTNFFGRLFVDTYYKLSPPIAAWLPRHPWMSSNIRHLLNHLARHISNKLN